MSVYAFAPPPKSPEAEIVRAEVRAFLNAEMADRSPRERAESWNGLDPAFSRKMGERGWIGMTWPKQYGGHERTALERYVVLEEMLAAGAPVACALDRRSPERAADPARRHRGAEGQILPRIAAGEASSASA